MNLSGQGYLVLSLVVLGFVWLLVAFTGDA